MNHNSERKNLNFGGQASAGNSAGGGQDGVGDKTGGGQDGARAPNPVLALPPLPKRFYKNAELGEADAGRAEAAGAAGEGQTALLYTILLDGRAVKTPARRLLAVPSRALAELIRDEFRAQKEVINPALMPITRLANTVIDAVAADMQPVLEDILRYLACDMVFYRADSPRSLAERQAKNWDKALDWALSAMGADFKAGEGVMFIEQTPEAMAAAQAYLRHLFPIQVKTIYAEEGEETGQASRQADSPAQDARREREAAAAPFRLAALHLMVNLTGSALLALMAQAGALPLAQIWTLAHLEEDWTAEQWGQDAEAMQKRAARARDFYAAAAVMEALRGEK